MLGGWSDGGVGVWGKGSFAWSSRLGALVGCIIWRSIARSSIGRSSIGRSSIGRSSIGRSSIGRSSIGRSSIGRSVAGTVYYIFMAIDQC